MQFRATILSLKSYFYNRGAMVPALLVLFGVIFTPVSGHAQRSIEGIAAIVNDEVISLFDVDQRVDLFFVTSGIAQTLENREQLRGQVLRALIDEKLQMQEAQRVEIKIDKTEIEDGLKRIAADNRQSVKDIEEFLAENNIQRNALTRQIEVELAWSQFIRRSFGGRIIISDQEVTEQYERIKKTLNEPSYRLQEILIGMDSFTDEKNVQNLIQQIMQQLQAGVNFGSLARQFSIAPSAARNGNIGWVNAGQVSPEVESVLKTMQKGQISPPIQTLSGIYIVALRDKKKSNAGDKMKNMYQLLDIAFATQNDAQKLMVEFTTCKQAQRTAKSAYNAITVTQKGPAPLKDFDRELQPSLLQTEAGGITPPRQQGDKFLISIVCDRKDDLGMPVSRDTIADNLFSQRMAMMARRHLRDLRRDAVIEFR